MSEPTEPAFFSGREEELGVAEKALVEKARTGEAVDLAGEKVRGWVVAELLTGRAGERDQPTSRLIIMNGVIGGGIEVEGCTLRRSLVIVDSRIEGDGGGCAVLLRDARVKSIVFERTVVEGGIVGDRVQVENGMFFTNGEIKGSVSVSGGDVGGTFSLEETQFGDRGRGLVADGLSVSGLLNLAKAKVNGGLNLNRARLEGGFNAVEIEIAAQGAQWGIDATSLKTGGDFVLEGAQIEGALGIPHADIKGRVVWDGLKATSGRDVAIFASGVNVAHGISARFAVVRGAVDISMARIDKGMSCPGIEVAGGGTAIDADGAVFGGNWDLGNAKLVGDFNLAGARIAGQLKLTEARLYGSQVGIRADGAHIGGGCYMSRAIVIGILRFPAVKIGNQFRLRGASLKVDCGAALLASGSVFSRDVELNGGMVSAGALVFDQVEIRGTLDLSDSLTSSAVIARAGVGGLSASGENDKGAEFDEVVLSLVDSRVNRVVMPGREDHRPRGIVVLSRAHVGAYLDFSSAWPPHFDKRARASDGRDIDHLVLDGFTYDNMSNPSGAQSVMGAHSKAEDRVGARRLAWLAGQEACDIRDHFKPQPWVQFAKRLAAQGYHDDARTISITRQRLALSSHSTSVANRWQGRILDRFALFGHNPWRTLLWMAFFIVMFAGVWSWAGRSCSHEGCFNEHVFVVTNRDAYTPGSLDAKYPAFNALGYSFDVFVPFISFGYADHWRPNLSWAPMGEIRLPGFFRAPVRFESGTGAQPGTGMEPGSGSVEDTDFVFYFTGGGVLYFLTVLEMLIGLALTSLALTGFTGLLRDD